MPRIFGEEYDASDVFEAQKECTHNFINFGADMLRCTRCRLTIADEAYEEDDDYDDDIDDDYEDDEDDDWDDDDDDEEEDV